jgi:FkbM family methyltransferase
MCLLFVGVVFMFYNFIEIGTSDFNTLVESCSDEDVGLCIEPIFEYLEKLPSKKNVVKVNCAVSNSVGEVDIFYVRPEDIERLGFGHFARGCNSINEPHPTLLRKFKQKYLDVVIRKRVPVLSWLELIRLYNIDGVDYLKVDTEGHDAVILRDYFNECVKNEGLFAKKILFERNALTNHALMDGVIADFVKVGYSGSQRGEDYRLVKK